MTFTSERVFKPVDFRTRKGRTLGVREYRIEDYEAAVVMYKSFEPKRVAQGLPPPDVPRIAHWLAHLQERSRALLAFEGQEVVGHAILCPISDAAVEFTIFVHQKCRREGLGTALTHLALDFAAELGLAEVFLSTELSNLPALCVYRQAGFQVTSIYGNECEMRLRVARGLRPHPKAA
jgi:RimJ/RimL family protein N-acetyltransferase